MGKLKRSSIKCPTVGECFAARTGGVDSKDGILVCGFINECFKSKEFENIQLLPDYLINIIAQWYGSEMIHWIGYTDYDYFSEDKPSTHLVPTEKENHFGIY